MTFPAALVAASSSVIFAAGQARQRQIDLVFSVRADLDVERPHRLSHAIQQPRRDGRLLTVGRIRGKPDQQPLRPAELAR